MEEHIRHISDTAFWIAAYRARETKRTDAVFDDKLAAKLAGERGFEMVRTTPHTEAMEFAMVVRTAAIDRLILSAISAGADTVINLGAGLDTRPYRLELPSSLHWIEVDFEHTIRYKEALLGEEKPRCKLQRIGCDLSVRTDRQALLHELGKTSQRILVITEGVIGYLTPGDAAALSEDLYAMPGVRYWIQDYSRGRMRRHKGARKVAARLKHTPLLFDVKEPLLFFGSQGWKVKEDLHILDEADRIGRRFPLFFPWSLLLRLFPRLIKKIGNRTYGYVCFMK
jgi:methyltransferase (TIGR00027 family)